MAIAPTGAIYKSLIFDGESSRNYGVYITGQAVYNAPERAVEMISIPNRNGAFALDKGYFENIEVTYPAGIFADNETDFAEAISDFRNFLCSRRGYVRLTDEYNPNEYRMAIYKSGLEVSPAQLKAGEFNIVFDCKPQRWLTSGETAVTIANNGTLTNPTLFESSPLLELKGYGTIGFNGYEIDLDIPYLGNTDIPYTRNSAGYTLTDVSHLNSGDRITVNGLKVSITRTYSGSKIKNVSIAKCIGWDGCNLSANTNSTRDRLLYSTSFPDFIIEYGTAWSGTVTSTASVSIGSTVYEIGDDITVSYDGNVTITITIVTNQSASAPTPTTKTVSINSPKITAFSTEVYAGTIYCDCDTGNFYKIENGKAVSMNHIGDLGSDLPKLASGTNTFTKSNTVTQLKVTPCWWKV